MARYPMSRPQEIAFFGGTRVLSQFAPELHVGRGQHSLLHRVLIILLLGFALSISACETPQEDIGAVTTAVAVE